jgi:hypothetical protein
VVDGVVYIENVIGGFGNDSITGSSVNNILRGGDGSDSLTVWKATIRWKAEQEMTRISSPKCLG